MKERYVEWVELDSPSATEGFAKRRFRLYRKECNILIEEVRSERSQSLILDAQELKDALSTLDGYDTAEETIR